MRDRVRIAGKWTTLDHAALAQARERFAEHTAKAQKAVEEILAGGKYCSECRAVTNHRAEAHDEEPNGNE